MNILIFSWRDIKNPKAGGSEIYFHELAKRWVAEKNKVIWITCNFRGGKEKEIINGIEIIRNGGQLTQYLFAPFSYFKYVKNADVIIDNENGIAFFTPLFVKNKKIFLHMHHSHKDVWFKEARGGNLIIRFLALTGYFIENWIAPLVYKKIKVITLSKSSAEDIKKDLNLNVVGIVNPAIELKIRKRYKKNPKPTILFMNRLKKYKGCDILIRAFEKIKEEIKDSKLLIAGRGEDIPRLERMVKKEGIKDINFLGYVSEEKKEELMQKAWIFVNPSFKEGWGIVNIEANYFGTPVIGSNVSGIKDSIIDGKTGLLFEYGNHNELAEKILLLLKNKRLRENLGNNGIKWAKKFDWDTKAEEYLRILTSFSQP